MNGNLLISLSINSGAYSQELIGQNLTTLQQAIQKQQSIVFNGQITKLGTIKYYSMFASIGSQKLKIVDIPFNIWAPNPSINFSVNGIKTNAILTQNNTVTLNP